MARTKKIEEKFESIDLYYSLKILSVDASGKETAVWSHSALDDSFDDDQKYIEFYRGKGYLLEKKLGTDVERYVFDQKKKENFDMSKKVLIAAGTIAVASVVVACALVKKRG